MEVSYLIRWTLLAFIHPRARPKIPKAIPVYTTNRVGFTKQHEETKEAKIKRSIKSLLLHTALPQETQTIFMIAEIKIAEYRR